MIITEPGIYTMPDAEYHADPIPGGSLSSTGAKRLLSSPARFKWDADHPIHKDVFDIGHAVHSEVLGIGLEVRVLNFDSWRTKASQAAKQEAHDAGLVPILAKDYQPIKDMAAAVLRHRLARSLLERPGQAEASLFHPDPETGVWMRARIDRLPDAGEVLADLKTTVNAKPSEFTASAARFGYDIQSEMYQHVLRLVRGDTDTAFLFIAVEVDPPHLVSVCQLADEYITEGRARMRRAINIYKQCKVASEWPGYPEEVHQLSPPRWYAMAAENPEGEAA